MQLNNHQRIVSLHKINIVLRKCVNDAVQNTFFDRAEHCTKRYVENVFWDFNRMLGTWKFNRALSPISTIVSKMMQRTNACTHAQTYARTHACTHACPHLDIFNGQLALYLIHRVPGQSGYGQMPSRKETLFEINPLTTKISMVRFLWS